MLEGLVPLLQENKIKIHQHDQKITSSLALILCTEVFVKVVLVNIVSF